MKNKYQEYINREFKYDLKTWLAIFSLIIVLSGIFGFVYEYIFYYFNSGCKTFYWRGSNFLPWINIYATGAMLIFFTTFKLRKKPWLVFIISVFLTGILEYSAGYMMYHMKNGIRCWDYNTEILSFGSIDGFVCLRSVLFFGLSSLILIYMMFPLVFYLADHMSKKKFLIISYTLGFIFLADEIYNLVFTELFNMPRASSIYKKLGFKYMNYFK